MPRNTPLPNTVKRDTTYGLDITGASVSQLGQRQASACTTFSYRRVNLLPGHTGPACNSSNSLISWSWLAFWFNTIPQTGDGASHTGVCQNLLLSGATCLEQLIKAVCPTRVTRSTTRAGFLWDRAKGILWSRLLREKATICSNHLPSKQKTPTLLPKNHLTECSLPQFILKILNVK